ncbi:hypothetical protein [Bacillus cereus]|uniref:hypothetical protein n=1 Tax=Bacillus cereus TaxID=1396 RepID=UPI00403FD878
MGLVVFYKKNRKRKKKGFWQGIVVLSIFVTSVYLLASTLLELNYYLKGNVSKVEGECYITVNENHYKSSRVDIEIDDLFLIADQLELPDIEEDYYMCKIEYLPFSKEVTRLEYE